LWSRTCRATPSFPTRRSSDLLPVATREESRTRIMEACDSLALQLRAKRFGDVPLEVEVDRRDIGGGVKNWEWIKKGVPVRIEIGDRKSTRLNSSHQIISYAVF